MTYGCLIIRLLGASKNLGTKWRYVIKKSSRMTHDNQQYRIGRWKSQFWFTALRIFTLRLTIQVALTHWGQVTHICVGKLTDIDSDNGLSPERRQAIIWTNVGILLIGPFKNELQWILIGIHTFSFNKMHLKMSSAKWRPFCCGLNVLNKIDWRVARSY